MTNNTTDKPQADVGNFYTIVHIAVALLAFESVLIIVINSLVFVLFAKFRKLRRKSNYCLVSLALSDFSAGVVVFPLFAVCNYTRDRKTFIAFKLIHNSFTCSIIIHLLLATCDRCLKIAYPFRYRTIFTEARIIAMLVIIWIVSTGVSVAEYPFLPWNDLAAHSLSYLIPVLVVVACIPFAIIVALNIYTRWLIISRNKNASNLVETEVKKKDKTKQQRIVCLYLTMAIFTFMIGLLAFFILNLNVFIFPDWVTLLFAAFKYCTHFVNPLMYTFFKADFRMAFKRLVGKEEPFAQKRSTFFQSKQSKETII